MFVKTYAINDFSKLCSLLKIELLTVFDRPRILVADFVTLDKLASWFHDNGVSDIMAHVYPSTFSRVSTGVDLTLPMLSLFNMPLIHVRREPKMLKVDLEKLFNITTCFDCKPVFVIDKNYNVKVYVENVPPPKPLSDDELLMLFNESCDTKSKKTKSKKRKSKSPPQVATTADDSGDDDDDDLLKRTVSVKSVVLPSKVLVAVPPSVGRKPNNAIVPSVASHVPVKNPDLLSLLSAKEGESTLEMLKRTYNNALCQVCCKAPRKQLLVAVSLNPEDLIRPCEYHHVCTACASVVLGYGYCDKCSQVIA
jgi:hypothetical protein